MELSVSEQVLDDEAEDVEEAVTEKLTLDYRWVLVIQVCFWFLLGHGPFYDMGTESKVNGGRRIYTTLKIFLEKWKSKQIRQKLQWIFP